MNILLGSQYISQSNLDRIQNIFSYLGEDQKIILSKLQGSYFSYIIFNPIYCINLKSFIDIIASNQSNNQQENIYYLIITLISLIIKEYKKLEDKNLYHNNLELQNILIFQEDCFSFTNLKFNQIQIKFYNFQDNPPNKSNDLSKIYSLINEILIVNEKINNIFKKSKFLEDKNLRSLKQFLFEQQEKMNSNKDKVQRLINPSKLEYLQKASQIFQEKLKEIDKSNFAEVLIWQYYYCYTQELKNIELQLSSILKRVDMNITIYQEAQSKLQCDLIDEINLLNSFYESQFKENAEQQLQIERIQNELKRNMQIDIQCEFIYIIKKELYNLEKEQMRKITGDFITSIWKYYQKKIQNEFFELIQTAILKVIERYAEI